MPLEGFKPQSDVTCTLTTRLLTFHALKLDICLICCYLMQLVANERILLDFQGNKDLFRKMFILSVGQCGQKDLCKVNTLRFHK